MTTTLTLATAAGSSAKSTTVVALAALLAGQDGDTVVIDLDPQADATLTLGLDPATASPTIGDVLTGRAPLEQALVASPFGVRVVPAAPTMSETMAEFIKLRGADMRLRRALEGLEAEVVLIDCPGDATSGVTAAGVCAADHVLSTTYARGKESKGLAEVEGLVSDFSELYELEVDFAAVIPCAVPPPSRSDTAAPHVANITKAFGELVTPSVRHSDLVVAAYDAHTPVPAYAPASGVARDYRAVLAYLQERGIV